MHLVVVLWYSPRRFATPGIEDFTGSEAPQTPLRHQGAFDRGLQTRRPGAETEHYALDGTA